MPDLGNQSAPTTGGGQADRQHPVVIQGEDTVQPRCELLRKQWIPTLFPDDSTFNLAYGHHAQV